MFAQDCCFTHTSPPLVLFPSGSSNWSIDCKSWNLPNLDREPSLYGVLLDLVRSRQCDKDEGTLCLFLVLHEVWNCVFLILLQRTTDTLCVVLFLLTAPYCTQWCRWTRVLLICVSCSKHSAFCWLLPAWQCWPRTLALCECFSSNSSSHTCNKTEICC